MARNLIHTVNRGANGVFFYFAIEDEAGLMTLTDYTVTLTMRRGSTTILNGVAVTKGSWTVDGIAYNARYEWTTAVTTAANFVEGNNCQAFLTLTKTGFQDFWPTSADGNRQYITVKITEP
jgi:hypothetical protein